MVWCGVVWCGVVWCGVVWCGVVWCGVVWCGVVWCGVVLCGESTVAKRQRPGCLAPGKMHNGWAPNLNPEANRKPYAPAAGGWPLMSWAPSVQGFPRGCPAALPAGAIEVLVGPTPSFLRALLGP